MGAAGPFVMRALDRLIDLFLVTAGFTGAFLIYATFFRGGLSASEAIAESGGSILAFGGG